MMNNREWLNPDESSKEIIFRYEDMIRKNTRYFFDVEEFENIIDFYIENNRPNSAIRAIEIASLQHPHANELQLRMAQVLMNTGRKTEALNILKKVERIEPSNPDVYLLKGIIFVSLNQDKDAIKNFEHALSLADEAKIDVLISTSMAFENAGKFSLALKYLNQALEADKQNTTILYELAYCHERLAEYEKSIDYYKQYLDEDPFSANVWYNLGVIYNILEDYDKAIDAYDYAIAIDTEFSSAYFNKANSLANKSEFEHAIEVYNEFIPIDNDNLVAHYYIGECYEKLEEYDKAEDYYNRTLKLDNNFADAWMGLGFLEFQKENYLGSIDMANKAISLEPENSEYFLLLANTQAKIKNTSEARNAYQKALELDSEDDEIIFCYSDFEYNCNNLTKAISLLTESYKEIDESPLVNYRMAAYSWIQNDKNSSFEYFEKALKQDNELIDDFFLIVPDAKSDNTITELIKKYDSMSFS